MSALLLLPFLLTAADDSAIEFTKRSRTETAPKSGRYHMNFDTTKWDAKKTAVVICDMWDKHWCPDATSRVGEMAPRMNDVVASLRKKGALIIHCPSDTMDFYKDTPQRKRAMEAPKVETKIPLERWRKLDPSKEAPLPIDDSDGGCETAGKSFKAWSRQHEALKIEADDAITDSAEAFHLMKQRGIENVLVMGVHTNMCVLGRPFSIRQLVLQNLNVVLVRDLTDTMYNPAKAPFVSHFTGTDLVVEHIEKFWCGSCLSSDLVGGSEFRFKADKRPTLTIIAAEDEYKTEVTLPEFALKELGRDFRVQFIFADAQERHHLPGIAAVKSSDILFISVRRRPLKTAELELIRKHVDDGKPVVGIRTTSHAFAGFKNQKLPEGVTEWATFDTDVLGCKYDGHHSAKNPPSAKVVEANATHPILKGVDVSKVVPTFSLYKSSPLNEGAVTLMTGKTETSQAEPLVWAYKTKKGGRVFYTSLGHIDEFKQPEFIKLLKNGVLWAAGKE
jgi:type 1 glutamine amidotransferase/nicotinamidase-related amidase